MRKEYICRFCHTFFCEGLPANQVTKTTDIVTTALKAVLTVSVQQLAANSLASE